MSLRKTHSNLPLEAGPRIDWTIDDSSYESYVNMVHFRSGSATHIIASRLKIDAEPTVLDIAGGSNGKAVHDLLVSGSVKAGAYTNLTDARLQKNTGTNMRFIDGDLREDSTWSRIEDVKSKIAPTGFSVVLHRPFGGLQDLMPSEYALYTTKVLALMANKGIFYTQIPGSYSMESTAQNRNELCRALAGVAAIGSIKVSDPSRTLADNAFCVIEKANNQTTQRAT